MADDANKKKEVGFFAGVKSEFRKITWPDRQSTFRQSVVVVVISVVVGAMIAVMDSAIQYGINFLTTKF